MNTPSLKIKPTDMGIECTHARARVCVCVCVCVWLQTHYGLVKRHVQFNTALAARHYRTNTAGSDG